MCNSLRPADRSPPRAPEHGAESTAEIRPAYASGTPPLESPPFSRQPAGRVRGDVPIACGANVYRTRPATTLMVIAMIAMLNTNDNSA